MNKGVVSIYAGFFVFLIFNFSLTSCQNEEKTESGLGSVDWKIEE